MSHLVPSKMFHGTGGAENEASATYPLPTMMGNFQQDTVEVDLTLDTNAYAANDVLAATQAVVLMASPPSGGMRGEIIGISVLDKDDQGAVFDLVVLDADVSIGTENSAVSISDTDAGRIIATERCYAYNDFLTSQTSRLDFPPIPFKVAAGTIWLAAVTRGAPTHTAAGIRLKITFAVHNAGLLT